MERQCIHAASALRMDGYLIGRGGNSGGECQAGGMSVTAATTGSARALVFPINLAAQSTFGSPS